MQFLAQCLAGMDTQMGLYLGLFVGGLVGGLTHCAVQCGVFVFGLSARNDTSALKRAEGWALLPYHLGRVLTYCALAAVAATALRASIPVFVETWTPALLAVAALLFFTAAFGKMERLPGLPAGPAVAALRRMRPRPGGVLHGAVMGLMPCAMSFAAIFAASTAPTAVHAVLAVMAFGAGTTLALIPLQGAARAVAAIFVPPRWVRPALLTVGGLSLAVLSIRPLFEGGLYG